MHDVHCVAIWGWEYSIKQTPRTFWMRPNVRFDTVVEPLKKDPSAPRNAEIAMKPPDRKSARL